MDATNGLTPVLPASHGNSDYGSSTTELRYYVYVLRRRWWLVLMVAVAVLAGAWWRTARQVPQYSAQVQVVRQPPNNLMEAGWAGLYDLQPEAMAVQLNLVTSYEVMKSVIDSLGLRLQFDDPRVRRSSVLSEVYVHPAATGGKYVLSANGAQVRVRDSTGHLLMTGTRGQLLEGPGFRFIVTADNPLAQPLTFSILTPVAAADFVKGNTRPEQLKQSMMIGIRYTSPDPVLAASVANTMAIAYKWSSGERSRKEARERKNLLAQGLREIRDSLAIAERMVQSANRSAGLAGLGAGEEVLSAQMLNAQADVRQFKLAEAMMLDLKRSLDAGAVDAVQRAIAVGVDNVGFTTAYQRILDLQTQRNKSLTVGNATERSQSVMAIDSQIVEQRNELRRVADANLNVIRDKLQGAAQRLSELQLQYGDVSSQSVAVEGGRDQVEALRRHHDMVAEKYYEAQIAEQMDNGSVEITQPADVPTSPTGSRRTRSFFFALIIGTTLGIIAAFMLEQIDTRVRDPEDAQRATSVGVIGLIPELKAVANRPLALSTDEQSLGAEAYRKLRTNLRFVRAERPRAIAVTSPSPEEGKSVTASNLALAIAQQGQSVLIIDADLRRPVQHEIFGVARTPGLSDALVGLVDPLAAVQSYKAMPNVFVLACGTEAPNPAELLGSEAFSRFLASMLEKFDTIIIDTPPVNLVTDAAVIGSVCDGVLLVAEAGRTDRSVLASAVNELKHARGSVLGIVLNRAGAGTRYGRYGKYGGYYSGKAYYRKEAEVNGNGQKLQKVRDWVSALI